MLALQLQIALKESLSNYESKEDRGFLEDLYLFHDTEENLLIFYDHTDQVLNKIQLPDDHPFSLVHALRTVLQQAAKERLFEKDYIVKPFTVSLVDKDFDVLEELFFLEDDTKKTNDSIWTDMEKDLDEFLENLLH